MQRIMDIHPGTLRPADRIPCGKTLVTSRLAVGDAEAGRVRLLQSEAGGDLLGMLNAKAQFTGGVLDATGKGIFACLADAWVRGRDVLLGDLDELPELVRAFSGEAA